MKIGLFYQLTEKMNGPTKLALNLISGLREIGVAWQANHICRYNGCLQSWVPEYKSLPRNTLMGPNLFVIPSDDWDVFSLYESFICPSDWVKNKYNFYEKVREKKLFVWPVGIDTNKFNAQNKKIQKDCFIYFKQRSRDELAKVEHYLQCRHLSYDIFESGNYEENELIQKTKQYSFCLLLTNTESQGIAYLEILSSNTPCFVFDQQLFSYKSLVAPATSVPYFSNECGMIEPNILNEDSLDVFLSNFPKYQPRQYIIKNHTLSIAAKHYVDLILLSHKTL